MRAESAKASAAVDARILLGRLLRIVAGVALIGVLSWTSDFIETALSAK